MSFSSLPYWNTVITLPFLFIYLVTWEKQLPIILVTLADPMLHSPMYFFQELVLLRGWLQPVGPQSRCWVILIVQTQPAFSWLCHSDVFLLLLWGVWMLPPATMAYDRYVAICSPLHYSVIMNPRTYAKLAAVSWFPGIPVATVQTTWLFSFPFCGINKVNHFFCDSPPVVEAGLCRDTARFEIYAIIGTIPVVMTPCLLILCSYTRIAAAILKIPSAKEA